MSSLQSFLCAKLPHPAARPLLWTYGLSFYLCVNPHVLPPKGDVRAILIFRKKSSKVATSTTGNMRHLDTHLRVEYTNQNTSTRYPRRGTVAQPVVVVCLLILMFNLNKLII